MYGPGDVDGLSPRVLCAAVYKHLGEKMKFAWDSKLRTSTVHVRDVAAACWHVAHGVAAPSAAYNLSDAGGSTQGLLASTLSELFGIQTGFVGNMASSAMKTLGLKRVAEGFNDKHMEGWRQMCERAGIASTVLTPYIDAELLAHHHLAVDGRAIEATGFKYATPALTVAALREQVDTYIAQGMCPPVL